MDCFVSAPEQCNYGQFCALSSCGLLALLNPLWAGTSTQMGLYPMYSIKTLHISQCLDSPAYL